MADIQVRTLTKADLPALLPVHEAAFAGSLGVMLGRRYLRAFLTWFLDQPDTINLIGMVDDRLAGYAFGGPDGYASRLNRDLLGVIALAVLTHPQVILKSGFAAQIPGRVRSLLGRSTSDPRPAAQPTHKVYKLVGIGVAPDFQRRGIAQALVREFEQRVWAQGYDEIRLSVYSHNTGAQALYTRCGWQPIPGGDNLMIYALERPSQE